MYVDDLQVPEVLHGVTVRSQAPRGRIVGIHFGRGIPWDEVVVVSAADIPGKNCISLITDDQPCLAEKMVNHPEEPILLLAHPDRDIVEEARRAVRVEVEPLPPILTLEDALEAKNVIWGKDNVFKRLSIEKGDIESVWQKADLIIEEEYSTGAQEQLYIEPNGIMAAVSQDKVVTVWGSMQCPYYVHKALTKLFGFADDQVRIIQTETGGGFGGKEEYPSMIAAHAALLAWKSGKPVKLIYDRREDMAATTKRHPARIHHRTAVSRDGTLLGMNIELIVDGGAYSTLSPVVLSRASIHAAGPYRCPHIRVRGVAVATNTVPNGAFRGFGAPQVFFALERHMNKIAAAVGMPPEELRRRNFLEKGDLTATGQKINQEVDLSRMLDEAFAASDYYPKLARFSHHAGDRIKRGIGFSTVFHGAGFTGSGERYLASIAGLEATSDGRVRILTSGVEMGQGANTALAQIVADTLRLPPEMVDIVPPDTAQVPNSGPTVASRTCMVIGKLLERAALDLRQILESAGLIAPGYSAEQFRRACAAYIEHHGALTAHSQYQPPPGNSWNDESHTGDAYGAYSWAIQVAEVSVDTATCEVRVENFVSVQEVGRVIHPLLAAGQIEGGVVQGIGYALYENVVLSNGRMENSQMTNYTIPTSADVPRIQVIFVENPYDQGPMGAKGLGELPIDGPAPAIVNAVENALGISVNSIPATPEVLMTAMEAAHAKNTLAIAS